MSDVRTREFFDGYAGEFDSIYSNRHTLINGAINRLFRKSMALRYARTLQGCRPVAGKRVLDVGCGPGHYSIQLAREGAAHAVGIDFAPGMIEIAREQARSAGVADRCEFIAGDFFSYNFEGTFDYSIGIGLMDYIADPRKLLERVLSLTGERAFFSFPRAGGVLAWQRQVRYRRRCPLYLYRREQVEAVFAGLAGAKVSIEPIARDYFVSVILSRKGDIAGVR